MCAMEDRLKDKVEVTAFEELEEKVRKLEISVDQKVEELKERTIENEMKGVQNAVKEVRSQGESSDPEDQKEIDARRSNMIIYRAVSYTHLRAHGD